MTPALLMPLQGLLLILLAPGINGVARAVKARFQGRTGAPPFQPYLDLVKHLAKAPVVSSNGSWVVRLAPYMIWGSSAAAAALVPVLVMGPGAGFPFDVLLLFGLLALGRAFAALAALDVASTFTGMGASRDMTLSALADPALLLAVAAAGSLSGSWRMGGVAAWAIASPRGSDYAIYGLAAMALALVIVVECGRVPVDNPDTHLELTMIHEGLVLEASGRYQALMLWGGAIKQAALLSLFLAWYAPWGLAIPGDGPVALLSAGVAASLKLACAGMAFGVLESGIAKMRFFQAPDLIGASLAFSFLALTAAVVLR